MEKAQWLKELEVDTEEQGIELLKAMVDVAKSSIRLSTFMDNIELKFQLRHMRNEERLNTFLNSMHICVDQFIEINDKINKVIQGNRDQELTKELEDKLKEGIPEKEQGEFVDPEPKEWVRPWSSKKKE